MILTIISNLDTKIAGLYSQLFCMMNHYIYSKDYRVNFKIDSTNWIYKSEHGWTDYFKPIDLTFCDPNDELFVNETQFEYTVTHNTFIHTIPIERYMQIIPEIYLYNENVLHNINNVKQKLNSTNYDSIYIRRGDKLILETIYSSEYKYIELLLLKNPNCHTIFLQTDDYTCFKNIQNYIHERKLDIILITTCNPSSIGSITSNYYKKHLHECIPENNDYISQIYDKLQSSTTIEDMNSKEIYEHTLELLSGVDICIHSNICICDFNSNISRFIKLAHKNTNNVFDINNTIVDFSKNVCPCFPF